MWTLRRRRFLLFFLGLLVIVSLFAIFIQQQQYPQNVTVRSHQLDVLGLSRLCFASSECWRASALILISRLQLQILCHLQCLVKQ